MRSLTVRVPLQYNPWALAAPGLEPQPPRCTASSFPLPPFGYVENCRVEAVGRHAYEVVFDLVPATLVGQYLVHCLRRGTATVRHMNPAPFERAQIRFELEGPAWLWDSYRDLREALTEGRWPVLRLQ